MPSDHHHSVLRDVENLSKVETAWDEYMLTIEYHFNAKIVRETTLFGKAYVWVKPHAEPRNLRLVQL